MDFGFCHCFSFSVFRSLSSFSSQVGRLLEFHNILPSAATEAVVIFILVFLQEPVKRLIDRVALCVVRLRGRARAETGSRDSGARQAGRLRDGIAAVCGRARSGPVATTTRHATPTWEQRQLTPVMSARKSDIPFLGEMAARIADNGNPKRDGADGPGLEPSTAAAGRTDWSRPHS